MPSTGFTLLRVLCRRNNLQSLLDTTPPKRVPVLWDGPAPAPSRREIDFRPTAPRPPEYGATRMEWPQQILYSRSEVPHGGEDMLYWALVFLVIALIAGVLGFTGVAVASAGIAKVLFIIFLILFLVSLISHLARGRV